jgi:hypothetical protein
MDWVWIASNLGVMGRGGGWVVGVDYLGFVMVTILFSYICQTHPTSTDLIIDFRPIPNSISCQIGLFFATL